MRVKKTAGILALAILFGLSSGAWAQDKGFLWNGSQWLGLPYDAKVGYIKGVGNLADYEVALAGRRGGSPMISRAFAEDLKAKTIDQIIQDVDKFYQTNPDQVNTPIIEVMVTRCCSPPAPR